MTIKVKPLNIKRQPVNIKRNPLKQRKTIEKQRRSQELLLPAPIVQSSLDHLLLNSRARASGCRRNPVLSHLSKIASTAFSFPVQGPFVYTVQMTGPRYLANVLG